MFYPQWINTEVFGMETLQLFKIQFRFCFVGKKSDGFASAFSASFYEIYLEIHKF